jgi:hypothetical protein
MTPANRIHACGVRRLVRAFTRASKCEASNRSRVIGQLAGSCRSERRQIQSGSILAGALRMTTVSLITDAGTSFHGSGRSGKDCGSLRPSVR